MKGQRLRLGRVASICALLALGSPIAAQPVPGAADVPLEALDQQVAEQVRRLEALRRTLDTEEAGLRQLRRALDERLLGTLRGTGPAAATAYPVRAPGAAAQPAAVETAARPALEPVGQPAEPAGPPVAQIFEEPGVLTPKGGLVLEPSLQYSYSSNNRVALLGYSVIPALVIGLIDVREVKRNTLTAALTARYGLTRRLELEARVPYVYRTDDTVSRELATGSSSDRVFSTRGQKLGDVELAARYQINHGGASRPYLVGGLRFKSRTGTDPFEVTTDCVTRCTGDNATGTGLPLELPTGSGFYSVQPSLTWLLPSDPAVLFGSFSYTHNVKRRVSRTVLGGEQEHLGTIEPGGVFGFNVGLGLALNEKSSISFGYDHSSVGKTRQNGATLPSSVRVQLGTLVLGYSHRLSDKQAVNVSVGAGLTRDTPDLTLTVRLPFTL